MSTDNKQRHDELLINEFLAGTIGERGLPPPPLSSSHSIGIVPRRDLTKESFTA